MTGGIRVPMWIRPVILNSVAPCIQWRCHILYPVQDPRYDADPAHEQNSESWCVPRPDEDQGASAGGYIQGLSMIRRDLVSGAEPVTTAGSELRD